MSKMLKTILFVLACACASKPESLSMGATNNGKNRFPFCSRNSNYALGYVSTSKKSEVKL